MSRPWSQKPLESDPDPQPTRWEVDPDWTWNELQEAAEARVEEEERVSANLTAYIKNLETERDEAREELESVRHQPQGYWYDQAMKARAERDKARAGLRMAYAAAETAHDIRDELEARVAELEGALDAILFADGEIECRRLARRALRPQPSPDSGIQIHDIEPVEDGIFTPQPSEGEEADGRG